MKIALGMYTTLSSCTPAPAFKRALSLIYKPVLKMLYESEDLKFALYQSADVMRYFQSNNSEVNMLISTLAKKNRIKILSGIYSQSIISLNPPRERGSQIEKMTTYIRKIYGYRCSTAFFYGQIWTPAFISTLNNCAISSVAISTYKATSKNVLFSEPKMMNELGKRTMIYPVSDFAANLVSKFAQGLIGMDELKSSISAFIRSSDQDSVFFFINLDQLLQGYARAQDLENLDVASIFSTIVEEADASGAEIVHFDEFSSTGPGYLDSGWYGRDAYAGPLYSFNDIFVRNGMNRYLLNRVLTLSECINSYKKDRDIRRLAEDNLSHVGSGPLFIFDPQCGPLRTCERRMFWKNVLEAERLLYSKGEQLLESELDLEDLGEMNHISRNDNFTVVYSPFGGSVVEFDLMDKLINVVDAKSHFDKGFMPFSLKHSFADTIDTEGMRYKMKHRRFDSGFLNKAKTDMLFTCGDDDLPFTLVKHFKLRSQTFILESDLVAKEDIENGFYRLNCYLMLDDITFEKPEQKQLMLFDEMEGVKTIKVIGQISDVQLVFTSTSCFSVKQDVKRQSQHTVLGQESFNLYNKFTFSFPFSLKKGGCASFKLIMRSAKTDNKE